jgi:hypothetical protein
LSRIDTAIRDTVDAVLFALERVRMGALTIALILVVKIAGLHLFPTQAPMTAPSAVAAIR